MRKSVQVIIGAGSIVTLWIINMLVCNYLSEYLLFKDFTYDSYLFYDLLSSVLLMLPPVVTLAICIIGKFKNMLCMSLSAFIALTYPLVYIIFSSIFSDDGNIFSWIYAFTIGILFLPLSLTHVIWDVLDPLIHVRFYGYPFETADTLIINTLFYTCTFLSLIFVIITIVQVKQLKENSYEDDG
ncbi:MAG: hypothetical protein GX051_07660 [Clostridiales bacterium]|nr:hypothetical protein [Clostridiales bacterium]